MKGSVALSKRKVQPPFKRGVIPYKIIKMVVEKVGILRKKNQENQSEKKELLPPE